MSQKQQNVTVFVCLKDAETRARWAGMLPTAESTLRRTGVIGPENFRVQYVQTLEAAETAIADSFLKDRNAASILLSDVLLHPDDTWRPEWRLTSAVQSLRDEFADKVYVSLAVDDKEARVPDVDLVLGNGCKADRLSSGLELLIQRLQYYARPEQRQKPQGLDVRPLNTQSEMRDSFRMRHSVYRTMGYLDEDALDNETEMELNWCDLSSNHFGAFIKKSNGGQELIGTARLILTRGNDLRYKQWTKQISKIAPSLGRLVSRQQAEMCQFRLPIFHTLPLNKEMCRAFNSEFPWAELSRVIVAPGWRGFGIARELVKRAIAEADRLNAESLLLECLELHKPMYEVFGFTLLLGERGEVMGVGKTMIGMQRARPALMLVK